MRLSYAEICQSPALLALFGSPPPIVMNLKRFRKDSVQKGDGRPALDPSDAELIAAAQAGAMEAFGALYRRYLTPIFRYVRSRVSGQRDAEDVTEAVFLKAFESLAQYEDRGLPYGAFLYQVARNAIVDYYRSGEPLEPLELAEQAWDGEPGVERNLIEAQEHRRIKAALDSLPEHFQEVIRLRLMMGLPTDQVAEWMNINPAAVRVKQHRALQALRRALEAVDERT